MNPNDGERGEAGRVWVCIPDSSKGSREERAWTTSLTQHQGGMQRPELGCTTENHTIFWGAFPPPVANPCPYSHGEQPSFFKASSSMSLLTAVLTCVRRENKSVLIHRWNQGLILIITQVFLSVTQQTFMAFLTIY